MKPFRVLMVCSGNLCRSPMAEAMLRHMLSGDWRERVEVASAGTHAWDGNPVAPFAVQAMRRFGIDIAGHRARSIGVQTIAESDLILTMERFHGEILRQSFPHEKTRIELLCGFGPSRMCEEVPDPYGHPLPAYLTCAQIIRDCLQGVLEFIREELK